MEILYENLGTNPKILKKKITFSLFYAVVLSTMQNSQIQDLFPVRLSPIKDKIQGFPPFYTKPEINHGQRKNINISLRKKCQYSEFFWSVFSSIRQNTEIYGVSQRKRSFLFQNILTILRILRVIMLKNTIRNKSLKDCLRTASYLLLKCCKRKWMQVPC